MEFTHFKSGKDEQVRFRPEEHKTLGIRLFKASRNFKAER